MEEKYFLSKHVAAGHGWQKGKLIDNNGQRREINCCGFEKNGKNQKIEQSLGLALAKQVEQTTVKILLQRIVNPAKLVKLRSMRESEREAVLNEFRKNGKIPEIFSIITPGFNDQSKLMQKLCQQIRSVVALDYLYNAQGCFRLSSGQAITPFVLLHGRRDQIFLESTNAQALRNRYRLVFQLVVDHVLYTRPNRYKIISIACGSAQAIIHAIDVLQKIYRVGTKFELVLLDSDQQALGLAQVMSSLAGVDVELRIVAAPFWRLGQVITDDDFQLVEVCGLADYLSDKWVKWIIAHVLTMVDPTGIAIISNITKMSQAQKDLMEKLMNWWMVYREPKDFWLLTKKFIGAKHAKVLTEPWGIHSMAVISNEEIS